MSAPENQTPRLLREIREPNEATRSDVSGLRSEMHDGFEGVSERLKNLQQATIGESVLGRYTVAEVEPRLENIEQRLSALEKKG